MLTLERIKTRLAGVKGSRVGSKRRLDGQNTGCGCQLIWLEDRSPDISSPNAQSHSGNYMIVYEGIQ